jgi:hypothetical protein
MNLFVAVAGGLNLYFEKSYPKGIKHWCNAFSGYPKGKMIHEAKVSNLGNNYFKIE